MRKNVTHSSVIYDPLAPVDPVLLEKLMQHIKGIPPKPPAPADKPAVLSADHEGVPTAYSSMKDRGRKRNMDDFLIHDFTQFKIKPSMFNFKGNGYEDMLKG
ncbi:unnamed protein product, partial [Brassica oleracea]